MFGPEELTSPGWESAPGRPGPGGRRERARSSRACAPGPGVQHRAADDATTRRRTGHRPRRPGRGTAGAARLPGRVILRDVARPPGHQPVPQLPAQPAPDRHAGRHGHARPHAGSRYRGRRPPAASRDVGGIASLPFEQRAALVLHTFAGYPHRQVATILGATENTIKVRVHRARRTLTERLRELR